VNRQVVIGVSFLLLSVAWLAAAQAVSGRVLDPQGTPVAGAQVRLLAEGGELLQGAVTDAEGRFAFSDAPNGSRVQVRHPGFVRRDVPVELIRGEDADIALGIAGITESVAVTAARRERFLFETPQSVSVVRSQAMDQLAVATLPDALEGLAGVLVQRTTLGGGSPIIRGMVGNQVLLLVDGIRLNNSTYRLGPNQYFNSVDRFGSERVEVVRGPTSSLYGSDALGGTVNVLTESLPAAEEALRPRLSFGYDSATNAPFASARARGRWGGLGVVGGATFASFDDLRGGALTGVQSPTGFTRRAADFKLGYDFGGSGRLYGAGQFFEDEDVPRFDRIDAGRDDIHLFSPQRRTLGYIRYENELESLARPELSLTFSRMDQTEGRRILGRGSSALALERDEVTTYGLGLQLSWPERRRLEWTAGFEIYDDSIDSSRQRQALSTGAVTPDRGRFPDGSGFRSSAAYAQLGIRAGSRLGFVLGGRYNYFLADAELPGFDDSYRGSFDKLTGSASVVYELTKHLHLSGSVAEGFRAPALDDLAVFGEFNAGIEVPNPGLGPETLLDYEATLKALYPKLWTSFTVFESRLDGLIARAPGTFEGSPTFRGEPVFTRQNLDAAKISGAELDFGFWPADRLSLTLSLATTRGSDSTTGDPLSRIPPTFGRFEARGYLPWRGAWLTVFGDFATDQDRLSAGDLADTRIPPGGTPGFVVVSAGGGFGSPERLQLSLILHNLGDVDYRFHGSGINGPGRSVRALVTASWH
jgi:outer membrane receptor protein involved in Fe transport